MATFTSGDRKAVHSLMVQNNSISKPKLSCSDQKTTSGNEGQLGVSSSLTRETIRRKLTARVAPMTRQRETSEGGANLHFKPCQERNSTVFPTQPSCISTRVIKAETWESSKSYCRRKHELSRTENTDKDSKPPQKKMCMSSSQDSLGNEAIECSTNLQGRERRLASDNIATMSLLSASQCHLATLQDEDGDTPLHIAIAHCNLDLVRYLVSLMSCLTLDIYNNLRQTPLHLAVITSQPSIVRCLVEAGANVNLPDRNGQTPAHLACQRSSVECLIQLRCKRHALDLSVRNYDGLTPLHQAVLSANNDVIAYLVSNGADVNCKDGKSGRTPLHYAIESDNLYSIQTLLRLGANINAASYSGCTPLTMANGRGMQHVIKLLLGTSPDEHSANPCAKQCFEQPGETCNQYMKIINRQY